MGTDDDSGIEMVRVPDAELEFEADQIFYHRGELFTGVAYEDVPGDPRCEITYRDGVQHGPARNWYHNGQLKGETFYREGLAHGPAREYREDGSMIGEKIYEHAVLVRAVSFDADGSIQHQFELTEDDPDYLLLLRWEAFRDPEEYHGRYQGPW